jgi:hypothetical protein
MFLCRDVGHVNRYSLSPNHPATEAAPGQESKGRPLYHLSACRRPIQRISTRNLTPIPRKTCCRFLARCHAESGFCNSRAQPVYSKTPKSYRFLDGRSSASPTVPRRLRNVGNYKETVEISQRDILGAVSPIPTKQKKFILFMILRSHIFDGLCHE